MNMLIVSGTPLSIIQGSGGPGAFLQFFPLLLIFAIFYLLLIRPQQKKQRLAQQEREKMLSALKPGDKVVTNGGIYGTIVAVRESTVQLRIAQSVSIEVLRSAIGGLQGSEIKEVEAAVK